MKIEDFDFDLPDEAIALRPVSPRDEARLLAVSQAGKITDHHVFDLPSLLMPGDVLVLNETRVIPAALEGQRRARAVGGGGDVKVLTNLHKFMGDGTWQAFVRPAKRLKVGDKIEFSQTIFAEVTHKGEGGNVTLTFNITDDDLSDAIEALGQPPLPPYIARQRAPDESDISDYQTVYARHKGSVAAPTAGLHFTDRLFKRLTERGVDIQKLTLHVGAGTFLPVKAENIADHKMHSEQFSIDAKTADHINKAKSEGRRIIAIGTTALRALESAASHGILQPMSGETDIFITPGYRFQIVDGLMTNFHLPRSTLFMLVSALCGTDVMQQAYAHAIDNGYRFYSYGDASLLWKAG